MKASLILLAVLATTHSSTIRHLKLIPELDNHIEPNDLPNKQMKKFVVLTRRPNDVICHPRGSTVELTCEGLGVPAPNIHWFKNDAPVYEHNLESNELIDTNPTSLARVTSTLQVPRTEGEDRYTCIVSAGLKTVKASSVVYNLDGSTESVDRPKIGLKAPKILVSYKVFVDTIGNNVVLPCKVRGRPRPLIIWKDNKGNAVKNDRRMKVLRSGELVISSLRWSDMGEFTCRAENALGSQNITTFVYPAKAG